MSARKGRECILKIGSDILAKASDASLSRDADEIDITTRDSAGDKEFLQGLRSATIQSEALWVPDHAALAALEAAYGDGSEVAFEYTDKDGTGWTGNAIVKAFSISQALNDAVKCSITLRVTGALAAA